MSNKRKPRAPRTASVPPKSPQRSTQGPPPIFGQLAGQPAPGSPGGQQQAVFTGDASSIAVNLEPLVTQATEKARVALEELRGRPAIVYFLSENAQMSDEQMFHLYEHLRRLGPIDKLDLVLSSRGGATEIPLKIVTTIREFVDEFSVLVPYRAHSAATLVAMGADEIVMTDMAELGPIDPTKTHPLLPKVKMPGEDEEQPIAVSVQDLRHLLAFLRREVGGQTDGSPIPAEVSAPLYAALFDEVHPLAIGALEEAWELARAMGRSVLGTHMDPVADKDEIERIVDQLSDHYKSHNYPIGRREARAIGLKVKDATPAETEAMWTLNEAFRGITIQAEAHSQPQGTSSPAVGIGYIASRAAVSIGLGVLNEKGKPTAAIWSSKWKSAPGGGSLGASNAS